MLAFSACSKKSTTAATGTGTSATNEIANQNVKATSVKDFNLAGALNLDLPDSATGKGSAGLVSLLQGAKSVDACRMRQSMKQSVQMIDMIRMSLCHIEAEGDHIPFNTPVLLSMSGGPGLKLQAPPDVPPDAPTAPDGAPTTDPTTDPTAGDPSTGAEEPTSGGAELFGVYIDTKDADSVNVYMCSGESKDKMELSQVFRITGSKDNKSKGEMILSQTLGTMGFGASVAFDSGYTEADTFAMGMKMKFSDGGDNSFASFLNMKLVKAGVSFIQTADSGTFGGQTMNNSAAARFDDDNGEILFALDTSYQGESHKSNDKACVDGAGYMIDCSGAKFIDGGALYTPVTDVPGALPADFSATKPSGFDCAAATWQEVDVDLADTTAAEKHQACNEDMGMFEQEDCWDDATFAPSEETVDIPEDRTEISTEEPTTDDLPIDPTADGTTLRK